MPAYALSNENMRRIAMLIRRVLLGVLAAVLLVGLTPQVSADNPPATPTPKPPQRVASHAVITDVNGQMSVNSDRWQRLVVIGPDENVHPADTTNTTYAIVDTVHFHLVVREHTDGVIGVAGIDEQRGLLYLAVSTLPTRLTGAGTSYHDNLWIVDLKNGKVLGQKLFYEGEPESLIGLTTDPASGHVFVVAVRPGSGTYQVMMIEPKTMATNIQNLDGIPSLVFDDAPHHRVVVIEQVGNASAITDLVAFDSSTEKLIWTHQLQYTELQFLSTTYQATGVKYDPLRLQSWILAPGGLVTRLNIATGAVDRNFPLGYTRSDAWQQTGVFAIDMARGRSYAGWLDASACYIDRTDGATARHNFITYTGACGQANASLLTVDQYNGNVVVADTAALRIFSGRTAQLLKTYSLTDDSGQGSTWATYDTIQLFGHCSVVLIGDVRHQNDATGALTAGAAVFLPIS
jgi:hypothetical protein